MGHVNKDVRTISLPFSLSLSRFHFLLSHALFGIYLQVAEAEVDFPQNVYPMNVECDSITLAYFIFALFPLFNMLVGSR